MNNIKKRFSEPSTYAGIAMIMQTIPALIISPANPVAWGTLIAALFAVFKPENVNV